ncbi:MAG: hypothetical protein IJW40_11930 [Clostridia bacterium]|nr:hypothetical protein [Clostridia bacterium]MBQ7339143.1 hypothetical protein [Clostridia bacterium]
MNQSNTKKTEQLLDTIGQLPDEMILDAAPKGKVLRTRRTRRLSVAAACLVCAVAVGVGGWASGLFDGNSEIDRRHSEYGNGEEIMSPEGETAIIRPWEELPIAEQYTELTYDGRSYSSQWCSTEPELLGASLGEITVRGYDEIKDEMHRTTATLYRMTGVTEEFALAVMFPPSEAYDALPIVFIDSSWRPETLGALIDGLALESLMSFGTVYSGDNRLMYEDVPDRVIWELMLSERDAVNVYDESKLSQQPYGKRLMGVSVYISALGYRNISLAVTDAGYLTTNIGSTGKAFFIGVERTEEIAAYIAEHYEGKAYVIQSNTVNYNTVTEPEDATETPAVSFEGESTASYDPNKK